MQSLSETQFRNYLSCGETMSIVGFIRTPVRNFRDGIQLALAHAQASKDKEKFVLPLKEYRRVVDLVLTVRRLDV
jgi:hypothetical protein